MNNLEYKTFKNRIRVKDSMINIYCEDTNASQWHEFIACYTNNFNDYYWAANNEKIDYIPSIKDISLELTKNFTESTNYSIHTINSSFSINCYFLAGEEIMFSIPCPEITEKNFPNLKQFIRDLASVSPKKVKVTHEFDENGYGNVEEHLIYEL
jgi:hypothetical protein